jgi:hypothetical protein
MRARRDGARELLLAALWLLLAAAPTWAAADPPPPPPGPSFPSPQAIAQALLDGLGQALTGWLTSPDLRGALGDSLGELVEWGLRRVWDGLAWAFGGVNLFTALPPAWTYELPAVRTAQARLAPVAASLVLLGTVSSVLLAGLGTIIGRPFGWLWERLQAVLLATAGLAVGLPLIGWLFGFANALAGAILDPFGGLPGLADMSAVGQWLSLGWVAVLYVCFAVFFLLQRIKLVAVAALCCAAAPLALAAGALPFPLAQGFFKWWLTTTVGVALVHVLQALCLGIGVNVLLVGGAAAGPGPAGDAQDAAAGLLAAGFLFAAGTVPKLLLGGLAAAAGPSALVGPALQAATLLAGVGVLPLPQRAPRAYPREVPPSGGLVPYAGAAPSGGGGTYVRSLLAGAPPATAPLLLPPPPPEP